MLNLQVIGNLGSDAVVKENNGKKFVTFNVAHTDKYTNEQGMKHEKTTWVSCIWNGDGGRILPYLTKGACVFAQGPAELRVFDSAKDHCKKAGVSIRIQHLELVGGKKEEQTADQQQNNEEAAPF